MPLTNRGERIKKQFKKRYGEQGDEIFHAWLNKKNKDEKRKYEKE